MYISTWIVVVLVVVALIYFSRSRKGGGTKRWMIPTEDIWDKAKETEAVVRR